MNLSICRGDRPLHVSYDIDSLDPKETPSTGTPGEDYANSPSPPISRWYNRWKINSYYKMKVDTKQLAPIVRSSLQCINHFYQYNDTSQVNSAFGLC